MVTAIQRLKKPNTQAVEMETIIGTEYFSNIANTDADNWLTCQSLAGSDYQNDVTSQGVVGVMLV